MLPPRTFAVEFFGSMKVFFSILALSLFFTACAPNNVTIDNSLDASFKQAGAAGGCFALLDNASGEFTLYNKATYRDSALAPAATFHIVTALVGLQTGVISNDSMRLPAASNLSMYAAFRAGDTAYFTEVARRIGADTLQHWLDSLSYGSKKIKAPLNTFTTDRSLTLTPDEQLGLVKRLYFNQLPFYKVNGEMVKRAMISEQNTAYTLAYSLGTVPWSAARKKSTGWAVGWIEENNHPYFFVLTVDATDPQFNMAIARMRILKTILQKRGFLAGKQ